MRNLLIIILLFFAVNPGCKTRQPLIQVISSEYEVDEMVTAADFSGQATWLLGYVNFFQMTRPPHSEWYESGFANYRYDRIVMDEIKKTSREGITIKIVLGTWCPDTRREMPRFMRILDSWEFPQEKITYIGVDNAKQSPVAEYESLNIERVPTFIIYRNNNEAGRIIEVPTTSLEQDMLNILRGNNK